MATSCEMPFGLFSSEEAEEPRDLVGTVWELERTSSLDGEKEYVPPDEQVYAFRLAEGDSLVGQNDCNGCSGTYEIRSEDSISLHFICTEMACASNSFNKFDDVMLRVKTYQLQGDELRLSTEGEFQDVVKEKYEVLHFQATECREEMWFCE